MTFATFDPAGHNEYISLSGGNLVAQKNGVQTYSTAIGTQLKSTGKWYCEITIGGSILAGTAVTVGVANASQDFATRIGGDTSSHSWGYAQTGNTLANNANIETGLATWTVGDTLSIAFDADADTVQFYKNGVAQGSACTGVTGARTFAITGYFTYQTTFTVNTGGSGWLYSMPDSYSAWGETTPTGDAAVTMEPMTASGARLAAGAVTMTPMTAVGGLNGYGACVAQPMTVAATGGNNSGAVTMAAMTASVTGHQEHIGRVTMSPATATGTGYDQAIWTCSGTVPAPTLAATGFAGEVITVSATLPAVTLECHTKDVRVTVPAPTLSAILLPGTLITVTANVAAPILTATLDNPAIITVAASIPPPRVAAALAAGQLITLAGTLRAPTLSAQILTGNVATVVASVAAPIMSAAGYPAFTITFAATMPVPVLVAALAGPVAATYNTWVLNTRKLALTQYDTFAFNSYAVFAGKILGCSSSGISELGTQSLDNATAITARARTGKDSFGSSLHTRVPRIYTSLESTGDMTFRTITNEGGTRSYLLPYNGAAGLQQRRVPVGKGPRSRFWSFEVENVAGSDFSFNDVLAYPVKVKRRVI